MVFVRVMIFSKVGMGRPGSQDRNKGGFQRGGF